MFYWKDEKYDNFWMISLKEFVAVFSNKPTTNSYVKGLTLKDVTCYLVSFDISLDLLLKKFVVF